MSLSAFALPAGVVPAAPPRPGTPCRRPSRRGSRVRADASREDDGAGSDDSPDGSGDFSLRSLARRVEQIKRDEARGTTTMPVIVLDATLPGQRLGLRFDRKDTRRALNAGTSLGPLAEVGDAFAMLGQAPRSGQVLPFGVEVTVSRVRDFPDGSGDVEVELVGRRRVRIEGQPFDENGVAMAKVAFMEAKSPPGVLGGLMLQAINPKAYAVNTSLIRGFDYAPDAFLFEMISKALIINTIWIPIHLAWLWAGVSLHRLNLSDRTQRTINILMALSLLGVVALALWSASRG